MPCLKIKRVFFCGMSVHGVVEACRKFTSHKLSLRFAEIYDDVIKWKHFSRYWLFVRVIHLSPVNSPHKRPVTRSVHVFFDLRLNKRLSN